MLRFAVQSSFSSLLYATMLYFLFYPIFLVVPLLLMPLAAWRR
jgi:hypothetical protein